jgi:hypothetical protein
MSSSLRKGPSGHAKRKRAKELAALIQSQREDIHKFFRANTGASVNPNNELAIVAVEEEQPDNANFGSNIGENNVSGSENVCTESSDVDEQPVYTSDIYDPRNWDNLDNRARDILAEKGPSREEPMEYPRDNASRHFSYAHYYRSLSNGEKHDRKWLVYSTDVDKVFCFCCKIFKSSASRSQSSLAHDEFRHWRHIRERLVWLWLIWR